MTINTNLVCELQSAVKVQYLDGNLFSQDVQGNVINVTVLDGGEPATLSGSVSANIIRADGGTVAATGGTIAGNVASITLPAAAYSVPGVVSIVVKVTDSGVTTTIAAVVANIYQSSTDTVIDPGTIIPSVQTLIAAIDAAVASIPADYSSLWSSLAPNYSIIGFPVYTGYLCTYDGVLYRAKGDILSSETWNSSHWAQVNIGDYIHETKSAFNHSLSVAGENLLSISDFDTPTDSNVTYSVSGGKITITNGSSANYAGLLTSSTFLAKLSTGRMYRFHARCSIDTGNGTPVIAAKAGNNYVNAIYIGVSASTVVDFVVDSNTSAIALMVAFGSSTSGSVVSFDELWVKEMGKDTVARNDIIDLKSALDDYVLPVIGGKSNLFNLEKMKGLTGLTVVEDSTEIYGKTSSFSAVTELPVCLDGFPEKQQFRITMYAYNANASGSSLGLQFRVYYTDGTYEVIFSYSTNTSTYTKKSVLTDANKTVEKLKFSYSTGGSNIWHVKDIQVEAGTDETEYEAFEPSAIDYVARNIPSEYRSNVESAFNLMYNGINAVDYSAVTQGKYVNVSSGAIESDAGFAITDYIPIRHGMTLTANHYADSNSTGTCFYDINKQFIAGYIGSSTNRVIVAPEGSAYAIVTDKASGISELTIYVSIAEIKNTVKASTDNIDKAESSVFNGENVIDQTLVSENTRISRTTGAASSNTGTFATHYIPIREGMRLTMNKVIDSSGYGTAFYDINKKFIQGYSSSSANKVLTAPEGSAFVRMTFLTTDLSTAEAIISAKTIDEAKAFTVINQKTKWLAMGDSITFGVYSEFTENSTTTGDFEGWVRLLASAMNYDITVMASKGMGYSANVTGQDPEGGSTRINISTLLDRIVALSDDFNLITVAFGINDYNNPSSSSMTTIMTGLDEALSRLQTRFKFARLAVITPFNSSRHGNESTNYSYNQAVGGLTLKDIADAIKAKCESYGVECIYASNGFLLNNYNIETLLPDGVHPAKETHALIAKTMAHNLVY
jgi:lysophospholipase L1-like esterase